MELVKTIVEGVIVQTGQPSINNNIMLKSKMKYKIQVFRILKIFKF